MLKGILVISLQGGFLLFSKRYCKNFGLQPPNSGAKYDSHTLGSLLYTLCCYGDGSVVADGEGIVEGTGDGGGGSDQASDGRAPRGTALRRIDFGDVCVSLWTPEMKRRKGKGKKKSDVVDSEDGQKRNVIVAVITSSSWVRDPWELAAFLGRSFCSRCASALDETERVIGSPRPSAGLKRFKTAIPKVLKGFAGMIVQRVLLEDSVVDQGVGGKDDEEEQEEEDERKDPHGTMHDSWACVFYLGEELERKVGTRDLFFPSLLEASSGDGLGEASNQVAGEVARDASTSAKEEAEV